MNRPIMFEQQRQSLDVPSSHLVEKVALCIPCGISLSGNSCETSSLCSFDYLDSPSDIDTSFSSRSSSSPMAKALGQIETITLSTVASTVTSTVPVATHARSNKRRGKKGRKQRQRQPRPQLSPEEMATMPCRFFHSKKGCQRADCPYNHCLPGQ